MHLTAESWPSANPNNPGDGSEAGSEQSCHAANLSNIHAGLYFTTTGHVPARSLRSHQKTDYLKECIPSISHPPPNCLQLLFLKRCFCGWGLTHRWSDLPAMQQVKRTHLHRRTREESREGSTRIRAKAFTLYHELQKAADHCWAKDSILKWVCIFHNHFHDFLN